MKEHHDRPVHEKNYKCDNCEKYFRTPTGKELHNEAVHPIPTCKHCSKTFYSENGRNRHVIDAHLKCHECNKYFPNERAKEQHDNHKHP